MKILMIAPTPFFSHRGTHIRILEEARSLEQFGHDIVIATYHNGDDIEKYIETDIDVRRIRRWLFWYKKTEAGPDWQKVLLNIFLVKKVFTLVRKNKPDVIHAHLHEGVLIGRFVQLLFFWRKIPLVSDFHGSLVGEMRSHGYLSTPPLGTIFRAVEKWINGMGDSAIVSSEENIAIIRKARKDAQVQYVYDGVNVVEYEDAGDTTVLRKKYDVPEDAFIVVYTGALISNKGIDHILGAMSAVVEKCPDVHFVIGGFPAEWVRAFVADQQLEKSVTVISPLNYFSLAEVNALADVAIDPKDASVRQASGKLLQYMAANVGIICADRSTNRKYLSDDSALFLSDLNAVEIASAIVELYQDRLRLQRCARNAQRDAQKFDWKNIGKKIDTIYTSLSH